MLQQRRPPACADLPPPPARRCRRPAGMRRGGTGCPPRAHLQRSGARTAQPQHAAAALQDAQRPRYQVGSRSEQGGAPAGRRRTRGLRAARARPRCRRGAVAWHRQAGGAFTVIPGVLQVLVQGRRWTLVKMQKACKQGHDMLTGLAQHACNCASMRRRRVALVGGRAGAPCPYPWTPSMVALAKTQGGGSSWE